MKMETRFTGDVLGWWIKWSRIHRKAIIGNKEAESELATLKLLVTALKDYHKKLRPKY